MGIISKPNTFSANTAISSSAVNADFDTIYNEFNGSIAAANLATDAVSAGKIAAGAVTNTKLSTSAITLGYAEITSNFTSTTFGSNVDVTGLTVTVTVPSGGRRVKITGYCRNIKSTQSAGNGVFMDIVEDGVSIGAYAHTTPTSGYAQAGIVLASKVASAGSHTYKIQAQQTLTGTLTIEAGATYPAFILVELI